MEPAPRPWNVLASELVLNSPYYRLRRDTIALPDGSGSADYYVRESRGFAVVFALTTDDRVILVRQYKHGIGEYVLELPAGGIDPGESPAACAARELTEETGYVCDAPTFLREFILEPTGSNARYYLYLARDVRPTGVRHFDPLENITVELATIARVREYVCNGTINVGSQLAAITHALHVLDDRIADRE